MKRIAALIVAAALVLALGGPVAPAARHRSFLGTTGKADYVLSISNRRIKRGPARVEFHNADQDPHNLRFQRVGGTVIYGSDAKVDPDGTIEIKAKYLRTGTFKLWCSLPEHRARGMEATLKVVKKL